MPPLCRKHQTPMRYTTGTSSRYTCDQCAQERDHDDSSAAPKPEDLMHLRPSHLSPQQYRATLDPKTPMELPNLCGKRKEPKYPTESEIREPLRDRTTAPKAPKACKRELTAEARRRMAEGARARWARRGKTRAGMAGAARQGLAWQGWAGTWAKATIKPIRLSTPGGFFYISTPEKIPPPPYQYPYLHRPILVYAHASAMHHADAVATNQIKDSLQCQHTNIIGHHRRSAGANNTPRQSPSRPRARMGARLPSAAMGTHGARYALPISLPIHYAPTARPEA